MRFKQQTADIPQVNLIPMLNAMLAILAFFVMIAVSLSLEKSVAIRLPEDRYPSGTEPIPFLIEMGAKEIRVQERTLTQEALLANAAAYLQANPNGFVLLRPQADLSYEEMMELLLPLQELGGDRVSLVIQEKEETDNGS